MRGFSIVAVFTLVACLAGAGVAYPTAASTTITAPLDPALMAEVSRAGAGQLVHAIVYLNDQVDVKSIAGHYGHRQGRCRHMWGLAVYDLDTK
jgi:hypothetical protein